MKKLLVVGIITVLIDAGVASGFNIQIKDPEKSFKGNILYVGGSGPGNYTSIEEAISNSVDGDTIYVYDDSSPYYEIVKINKSINLIGENKDTTIIDGRNIKYVLEIRASNVAIKGFTIQNASGKKTSNYNFDGIWFGAIIVYKADNIVIRDNIIKNNHGEGLLFIISGNNLIQGNIIEDNGKKGIRLVKNGDGTTITRNLLKNNDVGIQTVANENFHITIQENNIIENSNLGIMLEDPFHSIVKNNNFKGNTKNTRILFYGIYSPNPNSELFAYWTTILSTLSFKIKNNYWDKPRFFPYVVDIEIKIFGVFSWMETLEYDFIKNDFNPAKKPFDIPGWEYISLPNGL